MSKKIVIANWKMNPVSEKLAEKLFISISRFVLQTKKTDVVICPPVLYLEKLKKYSRKIGLGGQNIFYEDSGAYTGEISAEMLYSIGGRFIILGHSERRKMGEKNEEINKKMKSALSGGLVPIVCVGEEKRDDNHEYLKIIKEQIELAFKNINKNSLEKIIIAYEPIWAIGKNAVREATPEEFREIKVFIKKVLSDKFGVQAILKTKILYGGSVSPKNCLGFLKEGEADGFLVGGASLNSKKFCEIISSAENLV